MTIHLDDREIDDLVRLADPARPARPSLDGTDLLLLEEIVSTPVIPQLVPRTRSLRRKLVSSVAAAAAITAVVGTAAYLSTDRDPAPEQVQVSPGPGRVSPSAPERIRYTAAVIKAAQENPRLLVDLPGWKASTVYGFAGPSGTIAYTDGTRAMEFDWYPADQYDSYHRDRLGVSRAEPVQVAGQRGDMIHYSAHDFAVMLPPEGKYFVEMRTSVAFDGSVTLDLGNPTDEQEYEKSFAAAWPDKATALDVLANVRKVSVEDWLASLPPEIVTPDKTGSVADEMLADIPVPPGFDKAALDKVGTNDRYQFGAAVTGRAACGWIAEWERAREAGDSAAVDAAVKALASSHDWKILHEMNTAGDYPEVLWEYADDVAAGRSPEGYRQGLGCR